MPPQDHLDIPIGSTIHLIGVCGTGMGTLAGLLKERGYRVVGSDAHPYPPMSTALEQMGIHVMAGYSPANLDPAPDLVVVGNICRPDHVEAAAARERGIAYASMPRVLRDLFLRHADPLVVTGTHGKTTTSALTAYLLHRSERDPSMLVGGITADFGKGYRLGQGRPFVIEGDEYDSAYFEKFAKFLSYAPKAAVITSIEHDHVDIYPSFESYKTAFEQLARLVPAPGPIAVFGGDAVAVAVTAGAAASVIRYGVRGDAPPDALDWEAVPNGENRFELLIDGDAKGLFDAPLSGAHNLRNTLAALILCQVQAGVPLEELRRHLPHFKGVARRQQVLGTPGGVTVYDDFAHHPTAVRETLCALRAKHPKGRLLAAFEPRSATACRRLHQDAYASAFDAADKAIIAPLGRALPEQERLDTGQLAAALRVRGIDASAEPDIDAVAEAIVAWVRPGDGVALLSNGGFGDLRQRLLATLDGAGAGAGDHG